MTIFGKRKREPSLIVNDAIMHAYVVHYVEHDKVVCINARDMQHACTFARTHAHVIEPDDTRATRELFYDDDRICVMLYGNDARYTCNIMYMPVHDASMRVDLTLR